MKNGKVAVISEHDSDLLQVFKNVFQEIKLIQPNEIVNENLDSYDSIAILGGTDDNPLLLEPPSRRVIETQIHNGKKVFAEYVASIGNVYFNLPESTRYNRLAYTANELHINGLKVGTLIDDQCGMRIRPHDISCTKNIPILQYVHENAHDHVEITEKILEKTSDRALWFDQPNNLFICSFRLSNFKKARFTPWDSISKVVEFIVGWLKDEKVTLDDYEAIYQIGVNSDDKPLKDQIENSISFAMDWFSDAEILLNNGKRGALEGFGTEVYSDGSQRISQLLRVDCIGEISLPYFFDYLLTGNKESLEISDNLTDYLFENFLCKEDGNLFGMMRWTNEAWGVCYQDDVARAIIPQLLKCFLHRTDKHLEACVNALQFLVNTTGTDGTRPFRSDNLDLNDDEINQLRSNPGNLPSAHYNAYYHAALLLAYKLTNIIEFKDTAIRGLTSIMDVYPETTREQSETQEYCRLILPLSWLYWTTGEATHKKWLYKVTKDLEEKRHESGGYLEWDTGYKASMRHAMGEGESSLLTKNGDPVVDLLYSNNWLPIAYIQAYLVTGDDTFNLLWESIAKFFISAQIHSDNKQINGAWARAYDVERNEVFGSPADKGWGPWAIESGWTVAEVASGLYMGLLKDQLEKFY
ncbi:hypothetical protein [Radiobacillus sp. PE A8.2]|uniref:hypothetical protein n=1 Tax=Radiobacillus sp. PE A8.2 TaxID=3380349 RepID=UPI00388E84AF